MPAAITHQSADTERVTSLAGASADSGASWHADKNPKHDVPTAIRHERCRRTDIASSRRVLADRAMKKMGRPLPRGSRTAVAIARHPIHPMVVPFPIAFLLGVVATDLMYLFTGDTFWGRASLWLVGAGTAIGLVAGLIGTLELLLIRDIRHRAAGWSHFVMAVMLLAVGFINWLSRLEDPLAAIAAGGLYLSLLGAALVAMSGWLGGELVFEHHIGLGKHKDEDRSYEQEGHGDQ